MNSIKNVTNVAQVKLTQLLQNPYAMAAIKIVLVLYASQLAPKLPSVVQNTFQNTFVKIIALVLIAYLAEVDFQLAILIAVVFVLSTNILSGRGIFESYKNIEYQVYQKDMTKYTDLLGKPAVIGHGKIEESFTDNYPGCNNVTVEDLLSLFDGNKIKLQTTLQYAVSELIRSYPAESDAKSKLMKMARAVGLPYNIELNDTNAPFLASLLLNYGFKVSEKCQVPQ